MTESDARLQELLEEEETLQFDAFSNEIALNIGLRLIEMARGEGKAVTVDITVGEQQLFHYASPGTSADNDAWIRRKNRVVRRFGHSSFYIGSACRARGTTMEERYLLNPRQYAAHGGAFPIIIRGTGVVGTITASGLTQEEDHDLVVRVVREFTEMQEA
jgi:uncharacterized protein (UPF0303 family)